MQNLREYIRNNKEIFDDQVPDRGHERRFEERLELFNKETPVRKKYTSFAIVSFAASLLLVIGLGTFYFLLQSPASGQLSYEVVSEQFLVTNEFYLEKMNVQITEIECKLAQVDESVRIKVSSDLEMVVLENTTFVESIKEDANTELAMMYLVKHYKSNIEALESINARLKVYVEC